MASSTSSSSVPNYVGIALGITSQNWEDLGLDASGMDSAVAASDDLKVTAERVTALMLIRVVAWIQPRGTFPDLSTTSICRHLLVNQDAWPSDTVNSTVIDQLHQYVYKVLSGYQDVPYHSFKHCYHVTISTNKLMDLLLQDSTPETARRPTTYGFRDDPLMHLCLLFSALIHDVNHMGIPNRQLANEDDALAIKYNDQSIAENESLYLAFSELLKSPDYDELRTTIFPQKEDYRRFRSSAVNLVLATDIASPERSQIGKSKWKEAFGDPYETVERKVLKEIKKRRASAAGGVGGTIPESPGAGAAAAPIGTPKASRRMSAQSIMSDLSLDDNIARERPGQKDELGDDSSVSLSESEEDDDAGKAGGDIQIPLKEGTATSTGANSRAKMRKLKVAGDDANNCPTGRKPSMDLTSTSGHSEAAGSQMSGMALKFHRRLSSAGVGANASSIKRTRNTRLGLLRTVDLSGESIDVYNSSSMASRTSATGADTVSPQEIKLGPPEPVDALREAVVMETILKAADVAHNLQSFDQMAKWSNKLFLELRRAYVQGRGDSPVNGWFNNQIGFLDAYLLPLARKLDDMGVFGDEIGAKFAANVESNRDRWTKEGMNITTNIIVEGEKVYPYDDESTS